MTARPTLRRAPELRYCAASALLHGAAIIALIGLGARSLPPAPPSPDLAFHLVTAPQQAAPSQPVAAVRPAPAKAAAATPRPIQPSPQVPPAPAPVKGAPDEATTADVETAPSAARPPAAIAAPAETGGGARPEDSGVRYRHNPPPPYPLAARRREIEGRVVLQVEVDASGVPGAVRLAAGSGSDMLDKAALDAIRGWRFEPARRDGQAVAATVTIPIHFRLSGTVAADGR